MPQKHTRSSNTQSRKPPASKATYSRFSKSTVLVPPAWEIDNRQDALVDFITRVCKEVDDRVCPSTVSVVDDSENVFRRKARGREALPSGSYARETESPMTIQCPKCKWRVRTRVERQIGPETLLATAAAAAVAVVVDAPAAMYPLVGLPMKMKMFRRKVHVCPKCNRKLGKSVSLYVPDKRGK